jgi:hypothetical protein
MLGIQPGARPPGRSAPSLKELLAIRQALLESIRDCDSPASQRLRHKVGHTQTPQDLWMLRNDAYQIIAQRHNQTVAAERINALIEHFAGWVDPKQLVRIG